LAMKTRTQSSVEVEFLEAVRSLKFHDEGLREYVLRHPTAYVRAGKAVQGRIVFARFTPPGWRQHIYSVDPLVGASSLVQLTKDSMFFDSTPAFSRDYKQILFTRQAAGGNGRGALWLANADGTTDATTPRQLTFPPAEFFDGDWEPAWSPKDKIAFQRDGQIWICDSTGKNERPLIDYNAKANQFAGDYSPSWKQKPLNAKDMTQTVAFARIQGATSGIYTVDVTDSPTGNPEVAAVTFAGMYGFDGWPAYCPTDSTKIAFSRQDPDDHYVSKIFLYESTPAGGKIHPITAAGAKTGYDDQAPCWRPDGTLIAFQRTVGSSLHVFTSSPDDAAGGAGDVSVRTEDTKKEAEKPTFVDFHPNWSY
jgi:Tol biopolymer transport system component